MSREYRRLPKGFDRPDGYTSHRLDRLLKGALREIKQRYGMCPQQLLEGWSELVGPRFSSMARAIAFADGTLMVKVANSTLYSLLSQEKGRLLSQLRTRFPSIEIRQLQFRLG